MENRIDKDRNDACDTVSSISRIQVVPTTPPMSSSSSQTTSTPTRRAVVVFRYSIDVLSNGTEYTQPTITTRRDFSSDCVSSSTAGGGGALFLSIWKPPSSTTFLTADNDDDDDPSLSMTALMGRYAVSGVGSCDGLSRIAADQQYKLGPMRAVFCINNNSHSNNHKNRNGCNHCNASGGGKKNRNDVNDSSHDGGRIPINTTTLSSLLSKSSSSSSSAVVLSDVSSLPSILYACQQETMSMIVPTYSKNTSSNSGDDDQQQQEQVLQRMDDLIQLIHGNYTYPKVLLCSIPAAAADAEIPQQQIRPLQWWKVYNDEHIIVHATHWWGQPPQQQHHDTTVTDDCVTDSDNDNAKSIIYLFTFLSLVVVPKQCQQPNSTDNCCGGGTTTKNSLLILPTRQVFDTLLASCNNKTLNLPIIEVATSTTTAPVDHPTTILRILVLEQQQQQQPSQCQSSSTTTSCHQDITGTTPPTANQPQEHCRDGGWIKNTPYTCLLSPPSRTTTMRRRLDENDDVRIDSGLLVRGLQQTLDWRHNCGDDSSLSYSSSNLIQHFPFIQTDYDPITTASTAAIEKTGSSTTAIYANNTVGNTILLQTGTSILFDVAVDAIGGDHRGNHTHPIRIIDRHREREQRQRMNNKDHDDVTVTNISSDNVPRSLWPHKLKDFLSLRSNRTTTTTGGGSTTDSVARRHGSFRGILTFDENEIDLTNDDDNSTENKCTTDDYDQHTENLSVQLLILGTGCASPSPYRGASGYALIFPRDVSQRNNQRPSSSPFPPSSVIIAVEVGEAYCTQFHRYAEGRSLADIRLIWISHAHWDHYGGLVNLLLQIYQCELVNKNSNIMARQCKRVKLNDDGTPRAAEAASTNPIIPPWVVAPPKVLKYLKLIFDQPGCYYTEVHMDDTVVIDKVLRSLNCQTCHRLMSWVNVRVEHSCLSFGFILVYQLLGRSTPYIFSFSGDTRPCMKLVDLCRSVAGRYKADHRVDFLLHEATFDENEFQMSFVKKHSTITEAVMVGRDVDTARLLLTHFSQRYDSVPNVDIESARYNCRMKVGFALDGMKVIL